MEQQAERRTDGSPVVIVERIPGGAIVRLNRPRKLNAINHALATAAAGALDELEGDPEVRAIVLTGSGGAFCAGQDMAEASGRVERTGSGGAGTLNARVAAVAKPVIAAINGHCIGGGAVLALACDIRLCGEAARFRFPAANYGLVVAAATLPAAVGQACAKDLIFTGRTIDAAEAYRIGLVERVVPDAALDALARGYVAMIAANSPAAVAGSKRVINAAALDEGALALEAEFNRTLRGGPEHIERFNQAADRVVGPRIG